MNKNIHFFTSKARFYIEEKGKLREWLENVIVKNDKIPGEINLIITNDRNLNNINIKYLNTDTYTDIITFNLSEEEDIISGDIYISIDRVEENAKIYDVSTKEELRRVLVHGVLHLIGYKDSSPAEKRIMTRMENKFLEDYIRN